MKDKNIELDDFDDEDCDYNIYNDQQLFNPGYGEGGKRYNIFLTHSKSFKHIIIVTTSYVLNSPFCWLDNDSDDDILHSKTQSKSKKYWLIIL